MSEPARPIVASRGQGQIIGDYGSQYNLWVPAQKVEWPVRIGKPPPLADCLQHRAEQDQLTAGAGSPGTVAVTQVLSGLGGVGKSQLAAKLCQQRWAAKTVDLLAWIPASNRTAIVTGYADAAERLGIAAGQQGEAAATRFIEWLGSTDRRWLVILDDLTEPDHLREWWPPVTPTGSTVVTTRRRDHALTGHGRQLVEVGLFSLGEACAYLQAKLAAHPELADDVTGVATGMGRLPLALAQAAAYMLDEHLSCSRYLQLFTDRSRALSRLVPKALPDDHQRTVDVTWSLSIRAANKQEPEGLATPLLQWASLLDPDGIPNQVLTAQATLDYLTSARGDGEPVAADHIHQAIRCLHRYNLANHDLNNLARALQVHALIQRATRDYASPAALDQAAIAAADALHQTWPAIETDAALGQVLRANTSFLLSARPDPLWAHHHGIHPVLFKAGTSLGGIGQVAAAASYFSNLEHGATSRLGADHIDTLSVRAHIAKWRGEAGNPSGAAAALSEVLEHRLRVLGPDHADTLTTRHDVAFWHGHAGHLQKAASLSAELHLDQIRVLGPDHPATLTTRLNIARWRGRAGDPAGAAAALTELLADSERVHGPDHPNTLDTRHDIAFWHGEAGDPAGAVAALTELLADYERVFGPDHPDTLATRHNVAYWRGEAGDSAGTIAAFSELLADYERVLGTDHPHTLVVRQNIGRWLGRAGDPAGAVAAYTELLADRVRVLGPDHPDTLVTRHNILYWRGEAGDSAGTVATAFSELLADCERVLGPDHPFTLTTRLNIAYSRGEAGDRAAAIAALTGLLADSERVLGPDHPDTLGIRQNIAYFQLRLT